MAEQPTNLSDYELQRLAHIRRNHEFLVSLGLADAAVDPVEAMRTGNKKKPSKPRAPRRPKIAPPPESLRRSPRLKGEEAEFGAEIVNAFGDEDEVRPKKRARAKKQAGLQRKRMIMEKQLKEEQEEVAKDFQTATWLDKLRRDGTESSARIDVNSIAVRALAKVRFGPRDRSLVARVARAPAPYPRRGPVPEVL